MVLPVSPKVGLSNNYPMLNVYYYNNCPMCQKDKYTPLTNINENIPLSNKYASTHSTKNLFKNAAHQQAT